MKKFVITLLLCMPIVNLFAQETEKRNPTIGRNFHQAYILKGIDSKQNDSFRFIVFKSEVEKNGSTYACFRNTVMNEENDKELYQDFLFRQEGDKIYRFEEETNSEVLIMDFGLKEGDGFTCPDGRSMIVKAVRDTTGVQKDAVSRVLELEEKDNESNTDTWIEGVGSVNTGLFNADDLSDFTIREVFRVKDIEFFGNTGFSQYITTYTPEQNQKYVIRQQLTNGWSSDYDGSATIEFSFNNDILHIGGSRCSHVGYANACEIEILGNDVYVSWHTITVPMHGFFTQYFDLSFPGFKPGAYTIHSSYVQKYAIMDVNPEANNEVRTLAVNSHPAVSIKCQPTSVESIQAEANNTSIFDLTGRRLNSIPEKGMYIKGGRKYSVR